MRLLHIIATPRATGSKTLRVSQPLLEQLQVSCPGVQIETLDLFKKDMPALAGQNIDTKYGLMAGQPVDQAHAASWRSIEELIDQFLRADVCLISSPMWNFSIPYALKYYIDAIVQPGYLFAFNEAGMPVGLCQNKQLICVTSRGSDYATGSPMQPFDLQEIYLRTIFGFVGIGDIEFINVQPVDMGPARCENAIRAGIESAMHLAARIATRAVSQV